MGGSPWSSQSRCHCPALISERWQLLRWPCRSADHTPLCLNLLPTKPHLDLRIYPHLSPLQKSKLRLSSASGVHNALPPLTSDYLHRIYPTSSASTQSSSIVLALKARRTLTVSISSPDLEQTNCILKKSSFAFYTLLDLACSRSSFYPILLSHSRRVIQISDSVALESLENIIEIFTISAKCDLSARTS